MRGSSSFEGVGGESQELPRLEGHLDGRAQDERLGFLEKGYVQLATGGKKRIRSCEKLYT